MNSHGVAPNRFSYHYSFHYPFGLWSGLYLHHTFRFRCSPSSLYTFKISLAWLGIAILQVSPNLRNYTHKVSQMRLNFHKSGVSTDSTILACETIITQRVFMVKCRLRGLNSPSPLYENGPFTRLVNLRGRSGWIRTISKALIWRKSLIRRL